MDPHRPYVHFPRVAFVPKQVSCVSDVMSAIVLGRLQEQVLSTYALRVEFEGNHHIKTIIKRLFRIDRKAQ